MPTTSGKVTSSIGGVLVQSTSREVVLSMRQADGASTGGVVKPMGLVPLSMGGKVKPSGVVAQKEAKSNAKVVKPRKLAKEMDTKKTKKIHANTKKTDTKNRDERTKKIDEKTKKKESKTAKGSKATKGKK